ncbi:VOC family protein [Catenuloplanes atrovinosus]|uniref:PhnB protein n=1 Tax=Catenuloplanes atrovinosus TaxID=137266 RepID=A0AAE3YII9_9ACTN|nr:VOC family protein [Catenuloplanes atrovinosus]MDR7274508.1 PhnB protein [Catenuloplanes atrovinosus]
MVARLNPYINFRGQAREALEFYREVLGGEVDVMTFGQMGTEGPLADQVMHGQLETPAGMTLMVADTPPDMDATPGSNITISLSGDEAELLRGYWEKLSEGATVHTPLAKQMWGDEFGQLTDRYGVGWLVNIGAPRE